MKFDIPKSEEDTDKLISLAKDVLPKLVDDELFEACKHLIILAGSFNHNITRTHRSEILRSLAGVGEDAIDPVLEALVECSRAEQFDITKAFIGLLIEWHG